METIVSTDNYEKRVKNMNDITVEGKRGRLTLLLFFLALLLSFSTLLLSFPALLLSLLPSLCPPIVLHYPLFVLPISYGKDRYTRLTCTKMDTPVHDQNITCLKYRLYLINFPSVYQWAHLSMVKTCSLCYEYFEFIFEIINKRHWQ